MKQNLRVLAAAIIGSISLGCGLAFAEDSQPQMPMMGQGMMGGQGMGAGMMGGHGMMGPGMMGQGMMGPGMRGMMGRGMMNDIGPIMEGRLAYTKAELGITDAQTAAWDGYVKAVKARVSNMQEMHTAMMKAMHSGSALERLDARTKAMENVVEDLKAVRPALETLYNALSDGQKKKADALLGMGCCMI
jgi:LTXXQ motif family protein